MYVCMYVCMYVILLFQYPHSILYTLFDQCVPLIYQLCHQFSFSTLSE